MDECGIQGSHLHLMYYLPNSDTVMPSVAPLGMPIPGWGEGVRLFGKDYLVGHIIWNFIPTRDGNAMPLYEIYLSEGDENAPSRTVEAPVETA